MPNHYTTKLTIKGSEKALDAFLATHVVPDTDHEPPREPHFDFNTIVPMPEMLRDSESSSVIDDGLAVLGLDVPTRFGRRVTLEEMLAYPWAKEAGITTVEAMKYHIINKYPDCIEKAQKAYDAYQKYGHADWYSWSVANWGTKWNSYELEATRPNNKRLVLSFQTAWGPPVPVIEKLIERYPDLTFTARGRDEFESKDSVLFD